MQIEDESFTFQSLTELIGSPNASMQSDRWCNRHSSSFHETQSDIYKLQGTVEPTFPPTASLAVPDCSGCPELLRQRRRSPRQHPVSRCALRLRPSEAKPLEGSNCRFNWGKKSSRVLLWKRGLLLEGLQFRCRVHCSRTLPRNLAFRIPRSRPA